MNAIFGYLGGGGDKMTIWQKNWVAETIFWDQPWLYQSINYFSRWKNHFGRWKNYFSRWENYFGRWKNYFSMPAVGRLWPSDDYDDDDDDGSPTVRHHISWALSGFISLFRDATLSPHCPRGRAIQPGILNLLLCMKGGCWRPGFTFDTCVFCLDVKKNCDIIKKTWYIMDKK